MQNTTCAATPAPAVYVLPEQAHLDLIQMREHLRLLARLTEVGNLPPDAQVRPDAFVWSFSRLARDMDRVIDAAYWSPKFNA
jgi:hypothetical protein